MMRPQAHERPHTQDTRTARVRRLEAIIVSSDDDFLIELGPILGDRYRSRTADTPEAISAVTESSQWLAIVDAGSLPDARAAVARMEQQTPSVPIIVIAEAPAEWSMAVVRGNVIAVIARASLAGQEMQDALTAAEARLQSGEAAANSVAPTTTRPDALTGEPRRGLPLAVPIGAVVALALVGAGWWWLHSRGSTPPARAGSVATQTSAKININIGDAAPPVVAKAQTVLELLSAARVAFRDQKLLLPRLDTDPRGDSALEIYSQVLAQDPSNEEALDGIRRLFSVGRGRIQSDLASGKLDDATRLTGWFKAAGVDPDAIHELESSIAAARPKWLAGRAQEDINAGDFATAEQLMTQMIAAGADRNTIAELRRAIDARKGDQQLAGLASEVHAAIDAGTLIDPASDNARTRLQAMRTVNRTHPLTLAAQRDLQAALLARALDATHKDQFDVAQRYLGAAGEISTTAEVTDAKRQLQAEMDQVAQRTAAAQAAEARAKEVATPGPSSPPPSTAGAPASSASRFIAAKAVRPLNVAYPRAAAGSGVQGYVVVEFTLSADGRASNAVVVDAKPTRIFDVAATDAVLHGRYDASPLVDKQPVRARIRLNFIPN